MKLGWGQAPVQGLLPNSEIKDRAERTAMIVSFEADETMLIHDDLIIE